MKININDTARVTLTYLGAKVYNEHVAKVAAHISGMGLDLPPGNLNLAPKEVGDTLTECIWYFMAVFGPDMSLGRGHFEGAIMDINPESSND
ncbi:MAG: hypothetical protein GY847_14375 [Proteobacteria bacterium]|nr:hypothetical protein [Pseudomonadota bacterium]